MGIANRALPRYEGANEETTMPTPSTLPPPEPLTPVVGLRYQVTPTTNAEGKTLIIPNPERGHLALHPQGQAVVWTVYWQRRLNDGEIIVGKHDTINNL